MLVDCWIYADVMHIERFCDAGVMQVDCRCNTVNGKVMLLLHVKRQYIASVWCAVNDFCVERLCRY